MVIYMIYFDNSATTELSEKSKQKIIEAMTCFGNPSSKHKAGLDAKRLLDASRLSICRSLRLSPVNASNIIFTSCGTEANNTAIFGSVYSKASHKGGTIITTDSEHPSVENAIQRLESEGYAVVRISTKGGVLDFEQFKNALTPKVILVSLMMVNNETGAAYDVARFFGEAKKYNANIVTHCDAVQGYLKLDFSVAKLNADFISISAHKIHGPKGVGALYINPQILTKKLIQPYICGGGQEYGLRSGTENVIGIAGFGGAAEDNMSSLDEKMRKMSELQALCRNLAGNLGLQVNIPQGNCAPHIVSITLPDIKSETMLNYLSSEGIYVSSGSACSSHSKKLSRALLMFGLSERQADCTIRVSFCDKNTEEEVYTFINVLSNGVNKLVKIR